jgi:hypothetical protein
MEYMSIRLKRGIEYGWMDGEIRKGWETKDVV